jgi:hypothetical protein
MKIKQVFGRNPKTDLMKFMHKVHDRFEETGRTLYVFFDAINECLKYANDPYSITGRQTESTDDNGFGDKIETFYIRGVNRDFRVIKTTFGAYDEETGAELVGMGAEVSINEITDHDPETLQNIETDIADGCNEWTRSDDVIMNTAPAVRSFIYTTTYDSPETADEITARAILAVEANA